MENLNEYKYQKAKEKVRELKDFYTHATVYAIIMTMLILVNYFTTSFPWVIFPLVGWGLGLTAHGFNAHGYLPFLGKDWEERKIKEYMESDSF